MPLASRSSKKRPFHFTTRDPGIENNDSSSPVKRRRSLPKIISELAPMSLLLPTGVTGTTTVACTPPTTLLDLQDSFSQFPDDLNWEHGSLSSFHYDWDPPQMFPSTLPLDSTSGTLAFDELLTTQQYYDDLQRDIPGLPDFDPSEVTLCPSQNDVLATTTFWQPHSFACVEDAVACIRHFIARNPEDIKKNVWREDRELLLSALLHISVDKDKKYELFQQTFRHANVDILRSAVDGIFALPRVSLVAIDIIMAFCASTAYPSDAKTGELKDSPQMTVSRNSIVNLNAAERKERQTELKMAKKEGMPKGKVMQKEARAANAAKWLLTANSERQQGTEEEEHLLQMVLESIGERRSVARRWTSIGKSKEGIHPLTSLWRSNEELEAGKFDNCRTFFRTTVATHIWLALQVTKDQLIRGSSEHAFARLLVDACWNLPGRTVPDNWGEVKETVLHHCAGPGWFEPFTLNEFWKAVAIVGKTIQKEHKTGRVSNLPTAVATCHPPRESAQSEESDDSTKEPPRKGDPRSKRGNLREGRKKRVQSEGEEGLINATSGEKIVDVSQIRRRGTENKNSTGTNELEPGIPLGASRTVWNHRNKSGNNKQHFGKYPPLRNAS
ncbi:hypothetical protein BT69DRAFT_507594 [Atractiella rhizophila]|nr:hypothetical protein BT69DRAFT_507594 [Atractiella rhizophila]